ncbi:hypothetical protein ALC57_14672 [Trachymyrmex cornetzi]|uniref:Uncharacterized protein n=1 Tax=Trachymyrmex cornetzi TaxID=471704 RepID=A0A151IY60_9HYME|nr:hypothetical protein ALC57_14672 [Trachymyrmex cornetzi]
MRVAGHGAHWANKVGPPRVMTGFARGPALIAFYLFLIFCTPHRDAYMNGWTDRRTDVSQEGTSGPKGPPCRLPSPRFISKCLCYTSSPRRGVAPDRVMHRGTCSISHGSLAWDDGRWEGQGVWIGAYSSYELTDLQLEQTRTGGCGSKSGSIQIVKARKGRKCRDGKGCGNDSRSEFLVELAIDLATTTPRSPLAFFVKQVEIDVMLMEFREISANHMLSCAAAVEVGGKAGPSQKY